MTNSFKTFSYFNKNWTDTEVYQESLQSKQRSIFKMEKQTDRYIDVFTFTQDPEKRIIIDSLFNQKPTCTLDRLVTMVDKIAAQ